jgi:PhzF family phenazine biosynthesis protein
VSDADRSRIVAALRLPEDDLVDLAWVDNGPGWVACLLGSAEDVLACRPDYGAFGDLEIGIVGPYADPSAAGAHVEVRAFVPSMGIGEDPVTGSLNAGIAQWLAGDRLPASYVASQGTVLGRRGRVHLDRSGDTVWVGGDAVTLITGEVRLAAGARA